MKIYVAIPCLEQVEQAFTESLVNLRDVDETSKHYWKSSILYDSRNQLAQNAIDCEADYVLWLDSDMVFGPDLLEDLVHDMKPDIDLVTALFFARRPNYDPCVWTKLRLGVGDESIAERPTEIPKEPFEIDACGMAATLVRTSALKDVMDRYGDIFAPIKGYGEDLSFCIRAKSLGKKFVCDPRVKVGHITRAIVTEEMWRAWKARKDK